MLMPGLSKMKTMNKQLFLVLIAFSFLVCGNFITYSQTKGKKPVKCRENGKTVYRTKCKSKKILVPVLKAPSSIQVPPNYDRYGDPTPNFVITDGPGSGGGIGTGRGTGQGTGSGSGNGSGSGQGAGIGNGTGQGTGNGSGSGAGKDDPTNQPSSQPPPNSNETAPLKLLSKPRPAYNDEARNAQVQGTVTLRVVFLASGKIGTVSVVSGLPNGLTAATVEAAKQIRFQPEMKNGKPVTVTKQITYTFTLY